MTGLSVLRQAYALLDQPQRLTAGDGNESGLILVNQIYGDLWKRERQDAFVPLANLREELDLSWRSVAAMTYGVAALLCLNDGEERSYDRYLERYLQALPRIQASPYRRGDVLFSGVV